MSAPGGEDVAHRLVFEPISEAHDTAAFSCGAAYLDWFLDREALTLAAADVSRTFVLTREGPEKAGARTTKKPVTGYFTLEAGVMPTAFLSLLPDDALTHLIQPQEDRAGETPARRPSVSPLADLPVVYLAYLARDRRYRGQGYGDLLLVEALRKAEAASDRIGVAGVYLVASEEGALLYAEYGFRPFGDWPRKMFLPMAAVRETLSLLGGPLR